MAQEHMQRAYELFEEALECPPDQRAAFLSEACAGDAELRAEVEALLEHDSRVPDDFMQPPGEEPESGPEPPPEAGPTQPRSAPATNLNPMIGTRVGNFLVRSVIGSGGMGTVYLAAQDPPHRTVALKIIKPGMDTAEILARFEIEREALALMNHPGIAKVFDAGATVQGRPYFAMEYVPGVPITEHCDRHKLDIGERLELFTQVCDAVQHAHQKGVIHRDLKPGNILVEYVDGKAVPKIIDFGIAKALHQRLSDRSFFTESGRILGTLEYMSPEQAATSGQDIDTRTDIYSLGVVLYQLLTGALPIDSATLRQAALDEAVRIIREVEPAKPSTKLSWLSPPSTKLRRRANVDGRKHYGSHGSGSRSAGAVESAAEAPARATPGAEPRDDHFVVAVEPKPEAQAGATGGSRLSGKSLTSLDDVACSRHSDPRTLSRDLRGDLDWIVMKCLGKDRARRYESAAALAADIERHLRHEPVVAGPPSAAYRVRKFVRRNRNAVLAASLVALAVVAGLIGTTTFALREARERRIALQRAEETRQVADFQASMLSGIDAEELGRTIVQELREQVRAGLERTWVEGQDGQMLRRTAEEMDAALAQFDATVSPGNPTDVARRMMDVSVLTPAVTAIEGRFAGQPLVQAELLDTVGRVYVSLGQFELAEQHLRQALEVRRRSLGEVHVDVATSLNHLAEALYGRGDYAAATAMARQGLTLRRKLLGNEHVAVAESLNNLAAALAGQGDATAAEALFREALAINRRLLGSEHRDVALNLNNLAWLLQMQGDFAGAEALFREALALNRKLLGDKDRTVALNLNNLALALQQQGNHTEAEPLLHEALAIYRRLLGDEHPSVTLTMNSLALLLQDMGAYDEAESLYRDALAMNRKLLGNDHPQVALTLNDIGSLLYARGEDAAAEPLLREALALRRRQYGPEHPDVAVSLNNLGLLLNEKQDYAAAEPLLREALALNRKLLGDWHPEVATNLSNLASMLQDQGDYTAAEPLFREGLALRRSLLGDDHPDVAASLHDLAALMYAMGDCGGAEPLYREALAIREKKLSPAHLKSIESRVRLARALVKLGRFCDAESLLVAAQESCAQIPSAPPAAVRLVLEHLAELYDAWHKAEPDKGYDAKAAEWRAKLQHWQATTQAAPRQPAPQTGTQSTMKEGDE